MTNWAKIDDEQCHGFQNAVELVGRKWSSGILLALERGASRFSEITSAVIGLSDRMLAQRLRELESADLVRRSVAPTTPVQVRYTLTERGRSLMVALQPLAAWERKWGAEPLLEEGVA
ncbi:winged helix-turn-helix transcriptional regulator [Amnibacterium flavum]|uniref:Transcriptional regulator n=1 Tax=Amnibacterium flavum TaxID=2173173 RepID=A0A2V1HWS7_9MICO|nr:helix-turn-helix domain-containing protein [Amnibacterium flavum]PVZ96392.1 transcriptional regulator [Amnibacterium flavum]